MDKTKIVIEQMGGKYTIQANVNGMNLLDPLSQIVIAVATSFDVDKDKYFSLLDEILEEQKSDYPAKD